MGMLACYNKGRIVREWRQKQGTKSPQSWGSEKQRWKLHTSVVSIPFTGIEYYERKNKPQ